MVEQRVSLKAYSKVTQKDSLMESTRDTLKDKQRDIE